MISKISVIIPHYNDQKNLNNLIKSILSQENFLSEDEILVIDDKSQKEINEFKNKNIRYFYLEKNAGPSHARNFGIKNAKNEILFFLDSDTKLMPKSILEIKKHYQNTDSESILNGRCSINPINKNFFTEYKALVEYLWIEQELISSNQTKMLNTRVGCIKRDLVLKKKFKFNENIKSADTEDYEFSHQLRYESFKLSKNLKVQHDFPSFKGTTRVYFRRAMSWLNLFLEKKTSFSNGGTSLENAIGHFFGFNLIIFFFLSFYKSFFYPVFLISFILHFFSFFTLFNFCLKKKKIIFLVKTIAYHIYLSAIIILSLIFSILTFNVNFKKIFK